MPGLYLAALLLSIAGMALIDRRFRLFFWRDPVAATIVTTIGVGLFVVWDLVGISHGIFVRGQGALATGALLAPELPIEEPVFLVLLVMCIMIAFTGSARMLAYVRGRRTS